jgi:cell fate regulator YaaT (PSP1 superfamily)
MKIAQIQFSPWDKVYSFSLSDEIRAERGDFVIVHTDLGEELGKIIDFSNKKIGEQELKKVLRLASVEDAKSVYDENRKQEALETCQSLITKHNLKMKLIDVRFSFCGRRLTFAFVSEGRIDFRDLVKDLGSAFNLNIRLFQVGSRDQARFQGDCGPCGLGLCCRSFVKDFFSITSEMAEAQQVVHRGSDRISGMCGRLMCCLSFEYQGYRDLAGEMPPLGTKVKVENKLGTVISHHLLQKSIDVRFPSSNTGERDLIVTVPLKQLKDQKNKGDRFKPFKHFQK